MSQAAINYYISAANQTIGQIASLQQSVSQQQTTAYMLERAALTGSIQAVDALMAAEPSLQNQKIIVSDKPVLQILDTNGNEQYRVYLPSRKRLNSAYYTYLTGSGYNPVSAAEANAYWVDVQGALAAASGETRTFAIIEELAENIEAQIPALLNQLHILDAPSREWLTELAWEAGDGGDRSRELFANTVTSYIMSAEIDDYSQIGQTTTQQRILVRTTGAATDSANSLLDEINGNTDTIGLQDCFVPLTSAQVATNKAEIAAAIRFIPSLTTAAGIAAAEAAVNANATDPDILAEVSAELTPKNTPQDPVLAAIIAESQYAVQRYGIDDPTQLLLNVESAANSFVAAAEAAFGPSSSHLFRTMVAVGQDNRLSGVRRRESLVLLRDNLVPASSTALYAEIKSLLWMLGNQEIDTDVYTQSVLQVYTTGLSDNYWMLKSFVDAVFTTDTDRAEAQLNALAAITADLTQEGTLLTPADTGTFTDAINKLGTVAVTPEDQQVQFNRLRDISQRFSNNANTPLFRLYIDVRVGGGYLAAAEYAANYQTLLNEAQTSIDRDPSLIAAELQAFGNLAFTLTFANSLIAQLQTLTNDFFSPTDLDIFTTGSPATILGLSGSLLDEYWISIVDPTASIILEDAIVLSRTINTIINPAQRQALISADNAAITALNAANVADTYNALVTYTKPPYVQAQETAYLATIIQGNTTVQAAWDALTNAVALAVAGTVPLGSASTVMSATGIPYYPLTLYTKQNEYQSGLVIKASNIGVQGGRTLTNLQNSISLEQSSIN